MFYSHNILTRKGGSLGIVWVAANFQPGVHHISLTRREYCSVSIRKACEEVMSPRNAMALRLSANLMVGIVRVHSQQTHYIYVDSKQVWQRLKHAYEKNRPSIDLPAGHSRPEAVTLPDPTTHFLLDSSFPGCDHSFSLDSLLKADLFSMTSALPTCTPTTLPLKSSQGSPFTADPRDISMEEETEAPLETLQIQVPGEGGDFGDGVVVEGKREGPTVIMDDVPMPCLNSSGDSMSPYGGVGDISGESVRKEEMEDVVKEEEEGEEKGGGTDSVLLFDEQTNSFQLYNEEQNKVEEGTPIVSQPLCRAGAGEPPAMQPGGGAAERERRVRRKLAFDRLIKTKSTTIKDNMNSPQTTLRDKHRLCCPVPVRVKSAALLSQPSCLVWSPALLSFWYTHLTSPDLNDEPEFELEQHHLNTASAGTTPSSSLLLDTEVARGRSISQLSSSPGGGSAVELARAGEEQTLDSHHTTGLTAIFSDVSSFASGRNQSNLGFDTSSAQRQSSGPHRVQLPPMMEGLSPIADQTEASFNTHHGDLEFPDLDVSYGSVTGTPAGHPASSHNTHNSPALESEPLAYLSHVANKMGERLAVEFQELLPPNSSRRTASRAFSHILELVMSQVLTVSQEKAYGTITLHRGPHF